jgi:hypothetical protein
VPDKGASVLVNQVIDIKVFWYVKAFLCDITAVNFLHHDWTSMFETHYSGAAEECTGVAMFIYLLLGYEN